MTEFNLVGSKITADGDCRRENERRVLLGRRAGTSLWCRWRLWCPTLCGPMGCSPRAPLSMGFSGQEYWSRLPFPSPGDLHDPGIELRPAAFQADSLPSEPPGKLNDKSRQCVKKQRHHFANKGPYSQSYGFSSSHVWMWELDPIEGWALKNWCFQSAVYSPVFSKLSLI